MRRKSHGGKSRPVKSPTRRSQRSSSGTARALPVLLSQDDESESREQSDRTHKIVPETFSDSDGNGDNAGVVRHSMHNVVEEEVDLSPQIGNNNSEDSIREGTCIRCKRGDEQVLVCGEIGCLISVHEKCMGCNPWFDDSGKFYCPFCKRKQFLAHVRELRRKVKDAKKALQSFLEGSKVDERNEPCQLPSAGDGICHDNENGLNDVEVENQFADVDEEDKQKGMENGELGCVDQDTIVPENEVVQPNTSVVNSGDVGCRKEVSSGKTWLPEMRGHETLEYEQEDSLGSMKESEDERIGKDKEQTQAFCTSYAVEEIIQKEQEEDLAPMDVSEYDKEAIDALYTSHTAEERNAESAVKVLKEGTKVKVSENNEGTKDNEEQKQPETSDSPSNANAKSETESLGKRPGRFKRRAGKVARVQNVSPSARSCPRLKKAFMRRKASANKNVSAFMKPTTSKMSRESAKQHITMNVPEARRKRLHWTAEEEEKLKEGVKVFSQMTNVNIPWRKILEYGRHVFHETRSPIDLKDKWRNIVDKEAARVNR